MVIVDESIILGMVITLAVGAVGWLLRLERRLLGYDLNKSEIKHIQDQLDRLEEKIDKAESDHASLRSAVQDTREKVAKISAIMDIKKID